MNPEEFSHKPPPKEEEPLAPMQEPIEHPPEAVEASLTPPSSFEEPEQAETVATQEPTGVSSEREEKQLPPARFEEPKQASPQPAKQIPPQAYPSYAHPGAYLPVQPQHPQAGYMPGMQFPSQPAQPQQGAQYPQGSYQPGQQYPGQQPMQYPQSGNQPGQQYPGQQQPMQYPQGGYQPGQPFPGQQQPMQPPQGGYQRGQQQPMQYPQAGYQPGQQQPMQYPQGGYQPGQQYPGQQQMQYPQAWPQAGQPYPGQQQMQYPQGGYQAGQPYPGQQQMQYPQSGYLPGAYSGPLPAQYNYPQGSGYLPYPSGYQAFPTPAKPRRDGYLFAMSIVGLISSIIAILGGLFSFLIIAFVSFASNLSNTTALDPKSSFSFTMLFSAFGLAGLIGGGFGLYHSIRSLNRKPSAKLRLPVYWIFFLCYAAVIAIGFLFAFSGQQLNGSFFLGLLVFLGGIFPAFGFLSLVSRLLSNPAAGLWATTWRRLVMALTSGATVSVLLAMLLELILSIPFTNSSVSITTMPEDAQGIILLLLTVSVIAPLVEEMIKPLAPIILIGRMNSAAEAFLLGMASGIGFNLIETIGYISTNYDQWLTIAIERSTAGLLHGVGAGLVTLGWYYWTHRNSVKNRGWVGTSCLLIAILQHAIWNGSFLVAYLPGSVGDFLRDGVWVITNDIQIDAFVLVYLVLSIAIFLLMIYIVRAIRLKPFAFNTVPTAAQQTSVPVSPQQAQQAWAQAPIPVSPQAQQERAQAPVPVSPQAQQERAQASVPVVPIQQFEQAAPRVPIVSEQPVEQVVPPVPVASEQSAEQDVTQVSPQPVEKEESAPQSVEESKASE